MIYSHSINIYFNLTYHVHYFNPRFIFRSDEDDGSGGKYTRMEEDNIQDKERFARWHIVMYLLIIIINLFTSYLYIHIYLLLCRYMRVFIIHRNHYLIKTQCFTQESSNHTYKECLCLFDGLFEGSCIIHSNDLKL